MNRTPQGFSKAAAKRRALDALAAFKRTYPSARGRIGFQGRKVIAFGAVERSQPVRPVAVHYF